MVKRSVFRNDRTRLRGVQDEGDCAPASASALLRILDQICRRQDPIAPRGDHRQGNQRDEAQPPDHENKARSPFLPRSGDWIRSSIAALAIAVQFKVKLTDFARLHCIASGVGGIDAPNDAVGFVIAIGGGSRADIARREPVQPSGLTGLGLPPRHRQLHRRLTRIKYLG